MILADTGIIGLFKRSRGFDHSLGVKFRTYAQHRLPQPQKPGFPV
jgi:DNA-directed RNA polymerase specialized sigma subunit